MVIEGARARARAAVTAELTAEARRQLAEVGPAALSLRSVARAAGMVSSGVYRYFASRDDLLTALIVESYDELGAQAERAANRHAGKPPLDRWVATCRAVRSWGVAHPHEWALVYGSPVPGYQAPPDTIVPAQRVTRALVGVVADAARDGGLRAPAADLDAVPARLATELEQIATAVEAVALDDGRVGPLADGVVAGLRNDLARAVRSDRRRDHCSRGPVRSDGQDVGPPGGAA